jgi:hypothetical protein
MRKAIFPHDTDVRYKKWGAIMKGILAVAVFVCAVFFLGVAQADLITVNNYSFESPTVGVDQSNVGVVDGWTVAGLGAAGVFYPSNLRFTDPTPDGNQVLYLNNASASQTLSAAVLAAGYTEALVIPVLANG